jgi:hypothetical protein
MGKAEIARKEPNWPKRALIRPLNHMQIHKMIAGFSDGPNIWTVAISDIRTCRSNLPRWARKWAAEQC